MNYKLYAKLVIYITIQLSLSALAYAGNTTMTASDHSTVYGDINVVLKDNTPTITLSTTSSDGGNVSVTYTPSSGVTKTDDTGGGEPFETANFSFDSTTVGLHNTIQISVQHNSSTSGNTCSSNATVTFNIYIPKITTQTEATTPTPLTRTTLGVGELDDLTVKPTDIGTVNWTISAGSGTVSPTSGTSTTFTADSTPASSEKVTATFGGGTKIDTTFTIIAPSSEYIDKTSESDTASSTNLIVDTQADWYVGPVTVNFSHAQIAEGVCSASLSGYFNSRYPGGISHTPGDPLQVTNTMVSGKGWLCDGSDHIATGDNHPLGTPAVYSAGTFDWPIPWSYIVSSTTSGFDTVHHQMAMTMNSGKATLTLTKKQNTGSATQP